VLHVFADSVAAAVVGVAAVVALLLLLLLQLLVFNGCADTVAVVLAVTVARLATIDAAVWAKSCRGVVSVLAEHKAALLLLRLLL